jgi:hypothetical protein
MPYYDYPPQYNEIQYYPPTLSDAESWECMPLSSPSPPAANYPFSRILQAVCAGSVIRSGRWCPTSSTSSCCSTGCGCSTRTGHEKPLAGLRPAAPRGLLGLAGSH